MKRNERDQLLNEILTGEEVSGVRRASLERGLVAVRRARHRRAVRAAVLMALPVVLALAVVLRQRPVTQPALAPAAPSTAPAPTTVSPARSATSVRLISDEELLAMFPGRSLALIGPPGQQHLVFLDRAGRKKSALGM